LEGLFCYHLGQFELPLKSNSRFMIRYLSSLTISILFFSCSGNGEKQSLDIDEAGIDAYIAAKTDSSQIYDITAGMRFSKGEGYAYSAVRYSQNDTAILYTELIEETNGITYRNFFYKEGLPVLVEENTTKTENGALLCIQRRVYLNGAIILQALERSAASEEELDLVPFKEITMTKGQFDFDRAEQSITQTGDYEMKFGEFLVLNPVSYLILENDESGYNVALYLVQPDELINRLYENQEYYQGKTVEVYHEYIFVNGMQQMAYMGGELAE
jgi:hypothetical protein